MAYMNQVNLIGYLGRDPEVRQAGNSNVGNFNIASTKRWKDKHGNNQSSTQWTDVVCWGPLADVTSYLKKGSQVLVTGELETQTWEKDGKTNYKIVVRAHKLEFLDSKPSNDTSNQPDLDDVGF